MNESISQARNAIVRGDCEAATQLLRPFAEAGLAEAQFLPAWLRLGITLHAS
jgi:hypothetical protein